MKALKIVKWIIVWKKKINFADLVKDVKSVDGFHLPANFKLDGMTSHKHGLAAKTFSKWRPSKLLLSRQISSG